MKKNRSIDLSKIFKELFCIIIFAYVITFNVNVIAQNGVYYTDTYLFYDTQGYSQWTSDNPQRNFNDYLIDVQITSFGTGKVTIKDITNNTVVTHILNGKLKELYDSNYDALMVVYSATLMAYGQRQEETLMFILEGSSYELSTIVTTSVEYLSKGNYIGIKPISEVISSTGTGFIISNSGHIITNYHVVKGAKKINITCVNENCNIKYNAVLQAFDEKNDLALLKGVFKNLCHFY
jgi:S1-C subfamily serine protease